MTLAGPIPLPTLAAIGAAAGALVVVAYILKLRRRRHEVPFSKLWQRVLKEKESTSLWRKLQRLVSLLLQLLFLALLITAAADPRLGEATVSGRNVVIIVDASASMKATDDGPGKPSRIELAKDEARRIVSGLGGADATMLVRMDGQATALCRFDSDVPRVLKVVDRLQASDTPADLARALQAAADALRGRSHPLIVLIGDGAYPEEARARVTWQGAASPPAGAPSEARLGPIDLSGIDVSFVPVGRSRRNVGLVAMNARRYLANKLSYEVLIEVQNFGPEPETVRLSLASGEDPVDVKTLALAPGERLRQVYPDLGGGADRALTARIEPIDSAGKPRPADALALDDTAWALLPERRRQRVLLVGTDNLYLEGALLTDDNISVDRLRPEDYPAELAGGKIAGYDVVVLDGFTPKELPPSPAALYLNPARDRSPFAIRGEVARPIITDVNPDHPLTRWVTLADVNIDRSSVFALGDGDVALARAIRDPLVVAGRRQGRKVVAFGFGLDATDLMLRVAFPVMVANALDWFAGDDAELLTTYRTGHAWSIPIDADDALVEVTVRGPGGVMKAPVKDGRARFLGQAVGIYGVETGAGTLALAANLADPAESDIAPKSRLVLGGREIVRPPRFSASVSRSLWVYLALGAILLSAVEWLTYNRRITT